MADSVWPDIAFEESMIDHGVIIHCPDKRLTEELFDIFRKYKLRWFCNVSLDVTFWEEAGAKTCYRVSPDRLLNYGPTRVYTDRTYRDYIKCTFYGTETEDFDISEDEFLALLEAGGE